LTVNGNLDGGGPISGPLASSVVLTGAGKTLKGILPITTIASTASITTNGSTDIQALLTINSGGSLTLASNPVTTQGINAAGHLTIVAGATATSTFLNVTTASGVFSQTGGAYTIQGTATFAGGSSAGGINGGQLTVGGDFAQNNSASTQSFAASPGHRT